MSDASLADAFSSVFLRGAIACCEYTDKMRCKKEV
jgi:hypothetical protein